MQGAPARTAYPPFCADQYRPLLADLQLPDDRADEVLEALWSIMRTFVDLGWGVEGVQMPAQSGREKNLQNPENPTRLSKATGE